MIRKLLLIILTITSFSAYCIPVTSKSWIVTEDNGNVIQETNSDEIRSIASISKLVTAMIVLDAHQDLNKRLVSFTRRQLLQLALVKSDNKAAETLCANYPGGKAKCIAAMNKKVQKLGLTNTSFVDPTGLNKMNVSTARELVKVVLEAQKYSEIIQAGQTKTIKIKVKRKTIIVHNTNHDIGKGTYNFIVSKTGYIRQSGGCIVTLIETDVGRRVVVLLGSKNTHTRILEAEYVANYAGGIM